MTFVFKELIYFHLNYWIWILNSERLWPSDQQDVQSCFVCPFKKKNHSSLLCACHVKQYSRQSTLFHYLSATKLSQLWDTFDKPVSICYTKCFQRVQIPATGLQASVSETMKLRTRDYWNTFWRVTFKNRLQKGK